MRRSIVGVLAGGLLGVALAAPAAEPEPAAPAPERRARLVRMVRQDCGSCHGMRLSGGLGPPLTPAAMAPLPLASLQAVIVHGRPGTPMPGWRSMLDEDEARWIAWWLQRGFPEEQGGRHAAP